MAAPADVDALVQALPPSTVALHHRETQYGHLDFTWGLNAHLKIYPVIVDLFQTIATAGETPGHRTSR